jgi:YVTN family beta-propeller protein
MRHPPLQCGLPLRAAAITCHLREAGLVVLARRGHFGSQQPALFDPARLVGLHAQPQHGALALFERAIQAHRSHAGAPGRGMTSGQFKHSWPRGSVDIFDGSLLTILHRRGAFVLTGEDETLYKAPTFDLKRGRQNADMRSAALPTCAALTGLLLLSACGGGGSTSSGTGGFTVNALWRQGGGAGGAQGVQEEPCTEGIPDVVDTIRITFDSLDNDFSCCVDVSPSEIDSAADRQVVLQSLPGGNATFRVVAFDDRGVPGDSARRCVTEGVAGRECTETNPQAAPIFSTRDVPIRIRIGQVVDAGFVCIELVEPTPTPTPTDTAEPTPTDTAEPTPTNTAEPTPTDTAEPTPTDTAEPTPTDTAEPTPTDTAEPTPTDTATEVPTPTFTDTFSPSPTPTPTATATATRQLAVVANFGDEDKDPDTPGDDVPDTVAVIDTADNRVLETLEVGLTPFGVGITPDGRTAYVANSRSGTVSVIDLLSITVTTTITDVSEAVGIAVRPDGAFVYVTALLSVVVIDTASNEIATRIEDPNPQAPEQLPSPFRITFTPDGDRALVANISHGTVAVIDATSNTVRNIVQVGGTPHGIAVGNVGDQTLAYVAIPGGECQPIPTPEIPSSVLIIDVGTSVEQVIDTVQGVPANSCPEGVGIRPDGAFVYIANFGIGGDANEVFLINTATAFNQITEQSITVGASPNSIALTRDGRFAYVTNTGSDDVSVIDTAVNRTVETVANVGRAPQDIAIGVITGGIGQ